MRFTVVDDGGTMSFVAPGHALKVLAAACSRRPSDHRDLIAKAADYDAVLAGAVLAGLSAFDEHHVPGERSTDGMIPPRVRDAAQPFRVLDDETRRRSMEPARAGLVVFNLRAKRIVQVQNSYGELRRRGMGRVREHGKPTGRLYRYELPPEWAILP
jgi:hypothetical protein